MFKFGFIALCFLISLIKRPDENRRDVFLLRLGMFFTVAADLMMIIFYYNIAGLVLFCAVQLIYSLRFTGSRRFFHCASAAAILFAASFLLPLSMEFRLSVFYAGCIISSVSGSFTAYKKRRSRSGLLALMGMTLFLLCDINVALFNLFGGYEINRLFQVLIWVFYLPSQFLLSLSGKKVQETSPS